MERALCAPSPLAIALASRHSRVGLGGVFARSVAFSRHSSAQTLCCGEDSRVCRSRAHAWRRLKTEEAAHNPAGADVPYCSACPAIWCTFGVHFRCGFPTLSCVRHGDLQDKLEPWHGTPSAASARTSPSCSLIPEAGRHVQW